MERIFRQFPEVTALVSDKKEGNMRLGSVAAGRNREKVLKSVGIAPEKVVSAGLEHGAEVVEVGDNDKPVIFRTDALVCSKRNIFLAVTVADCFPVYFYDPEKKIVGIAHAGWRGTVSKIIPNVIASLSSMGSEVADIYVEIGPGIQKCHFEIGQDTIDEFGEYPEHIIEKKRKTFVDLPGIISNQLNEAGIPARNISVGLGCTFCDKEKYFSYRRDKPDEIEAMVAFIGMAI